VNVTVAIVADGFQEDLVECVKSIRAYSNVPVYVFTSGKENKNLCDPLITFPDFKSGWQKNKLGWGHSVQHLLNTIDTPYIALMDPSTHFTGDAISPTLAEIENGFVAVGWRGGLLNLEDEWRSVDDKGDGEVDVIFSYFIVLNRQFTIDAGGANTSATYYRNADLEMTLALRAHGGRLLQMELPLKQGRHHGYHDVDPEYREKNSKKNYQRLLDRFRGQNDILAPRR
jgi:hypothetical protein